MKLPSETIISSDKLKDYLLVYRKRNDKSKWLAQAGYQLENWQSLEHDLRNQILSLNAVPTDNTQYGQMYEIKGPLVGPNSKTIQVCTVWMSEHETGQTKFITMFPDKAITNEI